MVNSKKVLVAMSGGVDSSVAAALLKESGYDIIGVTMEIWPSKTDNFGGCCSASAVDDAKKVASRLKIPHYVVNFRDDFRRTVIDNFIHEYREGRTPNPCIRCNQFLKFDHLLLKADELGADLIATGHYARIVKKKGIYELKKALDRKKDQSYVLYVMGQKALSRTLFPLGGITKVKTREIARNLGFSVADKEDSQEICFIPDNDYGAFLSEYLKDSVKPGHIYDTEGNRLGMHRGIIYYTVGQRKGISLPFSRPFYVVRIDRGSNSIVVGDEKDTFGKELTADNVVWTSMVPPSKAFKARARIRYQADESEASVTPEKDGSVSIIFKKPVRSITPGQSVVLYNKDTVLGGGIICKTA